MSSMNQSLIRLSYWLCMVAMIFFILLILMQDDLQGRNLVLESKEADLEYETIYQNVIRKPIIFEEEEARHIVQKKIIRQGNESPMIEQYETIAKLPADPNFEAILLELFKDGIPPDLSKLRPKHRKKFDDIIIRASERHEVEPALIKAIIMAESSYNPKAVSRSGAKGLMQLMPRTAKALGVQNTFDPEDNIDAGVRYFKKLLDQFEGDITLALAAYNAGSRHVRNHNGIPPFKETRLYVGKVFGYYEHYRSKELKFKQRT